MNGAFFWRALGYCAVIVFIAIYGWLKLMPQVTIDNRSAISLTTAIVDLPNERLHLHPVDAQQQKSIRHSPRQTDGTYNYIIVGDNGERLIGSCGYVTSGMWGWQLQLVVEPNFLLSCEFPQHAASD